MPEDGVVENVLPRRRVLGDASALAGAIKRTNFLEAIRAGKGVGEAVQAAGWSGDGTYRKARHEHPVWASQVDAAKQLARQEATERASDGETPSDFSGFVAKFFPDRRPHLPHQLELVDQLQALRPREVCLFLLWPEAGKTATIEDYICRKLAFDPQHRFRVISEAADLSKRIIGTCARRFTDEAEYGPFINRYGPFYKKGQEREGKPWTTTQFTVWKHATERDRSLVAQSWSGSNYGSRIDTLIIDDVQSQANYNQADDIFRRIRGTFFNRGAEMRTLIVGTRIGQGDFYERMIDAGLITKKVIRPAMDADGNPHIPEYWDRPNLRHDGGPCCMGFRDDTCPRDGRQLTPREYMELMRHQSGEETWWASYQQEPSALARSAFGEFLDRCLDRDRHYGPLQVA